MQLPLIRRLVLGLKSSIYRLKIHVLVKYLLWCKIPVMLLSIALPTLGWSAKKKAILGTQTLETQGICLGADIPLECCLTHKSILLEENSILKMNQTPQYMGIDSYGCMATFQKIHILSQVTRDSGVCC